MADNIDNSIKNLQTNIANLDTNLKTLSKTFYTDFVEAVRKSTGDASRLFDDLAKKIGARDANKLRLMFEMVDSNGKVMTADAIQKEIDRITKGPRTKDGQKVRIGFKWVGIDEAEQRLKMLREQLRIAKTDAATLFTRTQNIVNKAGIRYDVRNIESTNHTARLRDEQRTTQMIEREYDKRKKAAERLKKEQQSINEEMKKMLPMVQRLGSAFGIAFSVQGLVQFGRKLIETRGQFELQQVAMRSILQNKQVADEIWEKTMAAALQSPFTAMQLTKYTKQLAAYRIETEKLFDTTKRLADVSAGLGVDMQRLILAYGQVKAANYLRASEIRQFTEAGVNILGELSTYLSQTRGEFISTAQVMEMVQKRMVTFADVEAIFKRMTDEGGIFYNMQYIQSQTVSGQINKLHDAYDQMLNSIGKANQGVIRDFVASLNKIIQNWRDIAVAIKSIGFGVLISWLSKLTASIMGLNVAGITAGKGVTKLTASVKALGVAMKANWVLLAIGAIATAVAALVNLNKKMQDVNDEIDEQNVNLYETKERLEGYRASIERNNKSLQENKGTEESLLKARQENSEILAKLKRDYPQLVSGIEQQKNGVIDLTEALQRENDELERQIALNSGFKQSSPFDESFMEDSKDLADDYVRLQRYIVDAKYQAKSLMVQLRQQGREGDESYLMLEQLANLNPQKIDESVRKIQDLSSELHKFAIFNNTDEDGGKLDNSAIERYYNNYLRIFEINKRNIQDHTTNVQNLEKEWGKLSNLIRMDIEESVEKYYGQELQDSGLDALTWYALNVDRIQSDVNNGVNDFYRILRTALEKYGAAEVPGMKDVHNRLMNEIFVAPISNASTVAQGIMNGFYNLPRVPFDFPGAPDIFATPKKEEKDPEQVLAEQKEKQAKIDAAWRRRIQLLEEMKRRYDELSKSAYGYAKSNETVRKEFQESWGAIFGGKLSMDEIAIMSSGDMSAAFRTLLVKAAGEASEAVKDEITKKSDSWGAKIPLEVELLVREDFTRQMEEMFSNYELTLELQKLKVPPDAAKDILGFDDQTSLYSLFEKVQSFRQEMEAAGRFDEKDQELYSNWMKKIESQVFNMQKERAKEYTKFLEKELSERAKLQMQYTKDTAFVEANFQGEQRAAILRNLKENFDQTMKEMDWKSFKESDFYVEMMQDLTSMPAEYLDLMMQKLNEWASKADVLSPRALKEVLKARERVMAAQVAMSPIRALGQSLGVIHGFQTSGRKDAQGNDISRSEIESRKQLQGIIVAREQNIMGMKEELALEEEKLGKLSAQEEIQMTLNQLADKGVSAVRMSADATADIAAINREMSRYEVSLAGLTSGGGIAQGEGETDEDFLRRKEAFDKERHELEVIIALYRQLRSQREVAAAAGVDVTQPISASRMGSLENVTNLRKEISDAEKEQAKDQAIMTEGYAAWNKAVHGLAGNIKDITSKAKEMGNQLYDTLEAVGVETDEVSDAWKDFGNSMVDVIIQAIEMIPSLVTGFTAAGVAINAAMGIIGLIALAIQAVLTLITGLSKIHDAGYEREIREQQERIDALTKAYERLEKQIEKTWETTSYIRTYNEMVENLNEQIVALENQRAAENAKKNSDEDKLKDYTDSIQEAYDSLDDLEQQRIETFGGIGEEGYRSAAEEFVSAWKDAFLETGDGLQALQDHFDEFLQEWFVKQATMRIAGKMLEPVFREIDAAVDENGPGGTSVLLNELQNVRDLFSNIAPNLSDALEQLAGMWNLEGEGGLSGLAAGIQGMTEEQANILEAYWNSVRMYVASLDMNVAQIASILGAGGVETNPMLQAMNTTANNTSQILSILQGLTKSGHPSGGLGIKILSD